MPQEIADSDDEGDVAPTTILRSSDSKQSNTLPSTISVDVAEHVVAPTSSQLQQDPLSKIDFDHFLSPTQRLSSYDGNHDVDDLHDASGRIDSSTDRFLTRLGHPSVLFDSSRSADGAEVADMAAGGKHSRKRSRAEVDDGAKSSSSTTSGAVSRKKAKTTYGRSSGVANLSSNLLREQRDFQNLINDEGEAEMTAETYETMDPAFLEPSDQCISVEERTQYTSPLQAYQPYAPNPSLFGTTLQGLTASRSSIGNYQSFNIDPNCNPFGRASQLIQQDDQQMSHDVMGDAQTSLAKGEMKPPQILVGEGEHEPQPSPPFSPITNPDDEKVLKPVDVEGLEDEVTIIDDRELPTDSMKAPPKKRGRKPKQKQAEADDNEIDELHIDETLTTRSVRATTVDSVSNMSEASQATSTGKRGRKKSKKSNQEKLEALPKKMPSSDLGLDNENVIGLPAEMYNPRPSKRRARSEPDPVPEILPEEIKDHKADLDEYEPPVELPPAKVAQKGKRGRKPKGKKGKTEVETEGTEVPEESSSKPEGETPRNDQHGPKVKTDTSHDDELAHVDDDDDTNVATRAHVSVDVPTLPRSEENEDIPPAMPEPKKRGRKRKKPVEEPVESVAKDTEQEVDEQNDRAVLADKDSNANLNSPKPTTITTDEENDKENSESTNPTNETKDLKGTTPNRSSATPSRTLLSTAKPTPTALARARIGLSKRHSIPSLLRKVDRNKEGPKTIERKEKVTKAVLEAREQERIAREEAEAEGREYVPLDTMRGKDGLLIEWDF